EGSSGEGSTGEGPGDPPGIGGPPGIGVGGGASAVSGAASTAAVPSGGPNGTAAVMKAFAFTGMRAPSAGKCTSCGTVVRVPRALPGPEGRTTESGRRSGAGMTAIGIAPAGVAPGTPGTPRALGDLSPGGRLTPGTAKPIAAPPTVAEA